MDERCLQCDHPRLGHYGTGCHRTSFLRGSCDCDFVEPAPLPLTATAEQHRERAVWWAQRIDLTDRRMTHAAHGSELRLRLTRLRKLADMARHHHLEMAFEMPAIASDDGPLGPEDRGFDGDDPLDLVSLGSIEDQPASTLESLRARFDEAPSVARDALRARLEAEFDRLEPRYRRTLLEDDAIRELLAHIGVVTIRGW